MCFDVLSFIVFVFYGSYSSDFSPAVLFLFLNMKVSLRGYQFGSEDKTHEKKKMP